MSRADARRAYDAILDARTRDARAKVTRAKFARRVLMATERQQAYETQLAQVEAALAQDP